jgi:ribosomal protein S9
MLQQGGVDRLSFLFVTSDPRAAESRKAGKQESRKAGKQESRT